MHPKEGGINGHQLGGKAVFSVAGHGALGNSIAHAVKFACSQVHSWPRVLCAQAITVRKIRQRLGTRRVTSYGAVILACSTQLQSHGFVDVTGRQSHCAVPWLIVCCL